MNDFLRSIAFVIPPGNALRQIKEYADPVGFPDFERDFKKSSICPNISLTENGMSGVFELVVLMTMLLFTN